MRRSKLVPLLAAAVVAAVSTVVGDALVVSADRYLSGTVRIGVNGTLPRWSAPPTRLAGYQGFEGFDVLLVQHLQERLGLTVELVQVKPEERESKLLDHEVDLVVANFSMEGVSATEPTKQRRDKLDFAGPYYLDTSGVLVHKGKQAKLPKDDQAQFSSRMCVSQGTSAVEYTISQVLVLPQEECFKRYSDDNDMSVVAVVTDRSILTAFAGASLNQDREPVLVDGRQYNVQERHERYGVAMRKDVPGLCVRIANAVNSFLGTAEDGPWKRAFDIYLDDVISRRDDHRPGRIDSAVCPADG